MKMNTFLKAVNSSYRSHKGMLSCEFIFDLHPKGFANKVLKHYTVLIESLDSATRQMVCHVVASQHYLNC